MTRLPALLAAAALLTVSAGCDSGESLLGEFEAEVDVADLTRLVEGEAVYTVVETERGPEFVLGLFIGDLLDQDFEAYDYVLFRRPGFVPGVGGYTIDDDPDRAVAATIARVEEADEPLESSGEVLRGLDGTLAVTSVDAYGFVAGTFQFEAAGIRVEAPSRAVAGGASGTFEARYETPAALRRLGLDLGL
jgi:hypothetical protein